MNDPVSLRQDIFLCPHTPIDASQDDSVIGSSELGSSRPSRRTSRTSLTGSGLRLGEPGTSTSIGMKLRFGPTTTIIPPSASLRPSPRPTTPFGPIPSFGPTASTFGPAQSTASNFRATSFGPQDSLAATLAPYGIVQHKKLRWYQVWSSWIVNHKYVVAFTTFLTVYALTADDFRLLVTNKPADMIFNVLTLLCLLCFSIEIVLSCLGKDDYFPGFFFGLDFVSTLTLILDLTWVSEHIVGDEDDFDKARSGRTARMGAKMGRIVRVIRLIRIVKLYKAYYESSSKQKGRCIDPATGEEVFEAKNSSEDELFWGSERSEDGHLEDATDDAEHRESLVGKKLSALTTRRVIILVLTMLLVLPLLRAEASEMTPASSAYGADDVHEAFRDMLRDEISRFVYEKTMLRYVYYHNWFTSDQGECEMTLTQGCSKLYFSNLFWAGIASNDQGLLHEKVSEARLRPETVSAWELNASRQNDVYNYGSMPPEARGTLSSQWTQLCEVSEMTHRGFSLLSESTSKYTDGHIVNCPDDLRIMERSKWNPRVLSLKDYKTWHFAFYFDLRPYVKAEARWNLVITCFVCLVLCIASVFFSKDANTLVLEPVEAMIKKVSMIRDDPLIATQMADHEFKVEELDKMKKAKMNKERILSIIRTFSRFLMCHEAQAEVLETVILDKTIIKLGTLLALGFGEAGANIVSQNLIGSNTPGVNAMIDGTRIDCILGKARIDDFSSATEVLQGKVMAFVNQIAEIVHGVVNEFAGAANKNNGETFLLIWRLGLNLDQEIAAKVAEMAMVAFTQVLGAVHRSPVLARYRGHPGLQQRLGHQCRVNLTFGLHQGWAIEGAVGTEFKIDPSYLSPHVSIASSVLHATSIYGVPFVASQAVVEMCSLEMADKCRLIDKVIIKGSKLPMRLYSLDLDYMSLEVDKPKPRYYIWNLRQRYRARQLLEIEKIAKWSPEVSITEIFELSPDIEIMRSRYTEEFLQVFNMGYQNYQEGEWMVARRLLTYTEDSLGIKDGPSIALLRYMETPFQFQAPEDWQGVHEFGTGQVEVSTIEPSSP